MELIKYISLSVLVICATACSKSIDVDEYVESESKVPDSSQISMMVDDESFTRAIPTTVESEAAMQTVGFYCAHTEGNDWADSGKAFNKYNNTLFEYNTVLSAWATENPVPWGFSSITEKYTFYAYSPYSSGSTKGINPSIDTATGDLNITNYTITDANMVDLLVATPRVDIHPQSGGKVNMSFNHALSRVKFLAKVDAATFSDYTTPEAGDFNSTKPNNNKEATKSKTFGDPYVGSVKVTKITWGSRANTGTLKMSANSGSIAWTDHSSDDADWNITLIDEELKTDKDNTPKAKDITQEYLLIPQNCNTDADVITVELYMEMHQDKWAVDWKKKEIVNGPYQVEADVNSTIKDKAKVIALSQSSMSKIEMGKVYELTIVVPTDLDSYNNEDFDIKVIVSEWSDAAVDIPNFN